jgi:predicted dehydrogenase
MTAEKERSMTKGVALIGTGFIGPVHVEALRRLGKPLVGVLASSAGKAQGAATALQCPKAYQTLDELLADDDIGSVHITSPNRFHFEQCQRALAAGKHVVCEKPLAMTAAESSALVQQAAQSERVAAVCYNIRFYPLCLEMRQRIRAGEIGEIRHVTGSYTQDWLLYDSDFNWRVLAGEGGALRAVADIGTHWLDLMQFVGGHNVVEVCADLKTVLATRYRPAGSVETFSSKLSSSRASIPIAIDTEDYGSVLLGLANGARGAFTVSQVMAGRKNRVVLEIAGAKGTFAWDSERPNELWLGRRDRANETLVRDPALLHPSVRPYANYPGGHNEGFPDTFKQLFRAIYAAIDEGKPAEFPTFADGHREILLCEAILKSQQERRWTQVGKH